MIGMAQVDVVRRGGYVSSTRVVSVKLPVALITAIDDLISRGYYQNRSDAIREAIRRLLSDYRRFSSSQLDMAYFIAQR